MQNIGEKFVSLLKKYGKKLVKNEKDSGGMYTSGINAAHQEKDAQFQKYHTDPWMLNAKKERLWSCDIYSADENQKLYNFAIGLRICTSKDCPCDGIKMAAFFQDSIVFLDDNADIYRLHDDYSWEHIDNLSNTIDDYYKIKIMRSIKNKLYLFTESHIYI